MGGDPGPKRLKTSTYVKEKSAQQHTKKKNIRYLRKKFRRVSRRKEAGGGRERDRGKKLYAKSKLGPPKEGERKTSCAADRGETKRRKATPKKKAAKSRQRKREGVRGYPLQSGRSLKKGGWSKPQSSKRAGTVQKQGAWP